MQVNNNLNAMNNLELKLNGLALFQGLLKIKK